MGLIPFTRAIYFFPTAESFGVSAQIGSGAVRGGPDHEGSTRVPPGFHEGCGGGASTKKSTACCWGYHLNLFPTYGNDPYKPSNWWFPLREPQVHSPPLPLLSGQSVFLGGWFADSAPPVRFLFVTPKHGGSLLASL